MTCDDARNPEVVGFFTAAFHYAAVRRAERDSKPAPSPDDVEKFARYVLHNDATANALWYRLLDQIFTYEQRQAELQKKLADEISVWQQAVGVGPTPIIPREDWHGTTAEECQKRMIQGLGIPAHLADPERNTPHFGPSPLRGLLASYGLMKRWRERSKTGEMIVHTARQSGKTATITEFEKQCMDPKLVIPHEPSPAEADAVTIGGYELRTTEFEADTLIINKNGDAYLKKDYPVGAVVTVVDDEDPQPILVTDTKTP